jgi:hypothetical protein
MSSYIPKDARIFVAQHLSYVSDVSYDHYLKGRDRHASFQATARRPATHCRE